MTPTHACEVCGARVVDLRRGRCFACYSRWCDSRPVGLGASCVVCRDRRRDNLRSVELLGAWVPMCFNCAGRTLRMARIPRTLDGIRAGLARDRRHLDRRMGLPDPRPVSYRAERRGLERRSLGHAIDGDLMLLDDDLSIEIVLSENDVEEITRIVARA